VKPCVFCAIVARSLPADIVHETDDVLVFLDSKPLFPGHLLVVPKQHIETLPELPHDQLPKLFSVVQAGSLAVESGLGAGGAFVAQNNKVSQSVPHLHVHVIPRTKGDGLKGFFWPRVPYRDEAHRLETAQALRKAFAHPAKG
jgi:histidine triad (HIT) family protein